MLHRPQPGRRVHTASGHQGALGVKGHTNNLSSVASKSVEAIASLRTPELCGVGGRGGEGGEGEEVGVGGPSNSPCRFYQMNQLLFYPCVSCEQSEFMREGDRQRERERERDWDPISPIRIIEGHCIDHVLVSLQREQLLSTGSVPHLASPVIAPCDETTSNREGWEGGE